MSNPRYVIVRAKMLHVLVSEVDPKLADGVWHCTGGPFWDPAGLEWCQAIERPESAPANGQVKLREPRR